MTRIIDVKPLPGYRLHLRFADGLAGEIDLSDLAGQGVFAAWLQPGAFESVCIDPETGTVCWPDNIDLCPETLYQDLLAAAEHPSR